MTNESLTIRKIASVAGTSRGTVDKVLHQRPGVSQKVRERVLKIASDLGYVPNKFAQTLNYRKQKANLSIILPNTADRFFDIVKSGINHAIHEDNYGLTITTIEMDKCTVESQLKCIEKISVDDISGLAIVAYDDDQIRKALHKFSLLSIPVATYNSDLPDFDRVFYIGQNGFQAGRIAGILMGKICSSESNIAIISGPVFNRSTHERSLGFKEIINSEHKHIHIIDDFDCNNEDELVYNKIKELLLGNRKIDGFYLAGYGAIGLYKAFRNFGTMKYNIICNDLNDVTK